MPFVDFDTWSTQSVMSMCLSESSALRSTLATCVSPGQVFFFWANCSVRQKWVSYLILSLFLQEEWKGAVITEACRWKANSINDTEVGCSLTCASMWLSDICSLLTPADCLQFWTPGFLMLHGSVPSYMSSSNLERKYLSSFFARNNNLAIFPFTLHIQWWCWFLLQKYIRLLWT